MSRVKSGVVTHARHRKVVKAAKGHYGARHRNFRTATQSVDKAMQCAGFATALVRGAEWAATGKVTLPIPDDFPVGDAVSIRKGKPDGD